MSARRILLARPHDFIVDAMHEFLTRNGFEPVSVATDAEIPPLLAEPLAGAVISTAVSSSVKQTMTEVYRLVRAAQPRLPVALSSLAGFDSMHSLALGELGAEATALTFLDVVPASRGHLLLGTEKLLLCLQRDAIVHSLLGKVADTLVCAHFAGGP